MGSAISSKKMNKVIDLSQKSMCGGSSGKKQLVFDSDGSKTALQVDKCNKFVKKDIDGLYKKIEKNGGDIGKAKDLIIDKYESIKAYCLLKRAVGVKNYSSGDRYKKWQGDYQKCLNGILQDGESFKFKLDGHTFQSVNNEIKEQCYGYKEYDMPPIHSDAKEKLLKSADTIRLYNEAMHLISKDKWSDEDVQLKVAQKVLSSIAEDTRANVFIKGASISSGNVNVTTHEYKDEIKNLEVTDLKTDEENKSATKGTKLWAKMLFAKAWRNMKIKHPEWDLDKRIEKIEALTEKIVKKAKEQTRIGRILENTPLLTLAAAGGESFDRWTAIANMHHTAINDFEIEDKDAVQKTIREVLLSKRPSVIKLKASILKIGETVEKIEDKDVKKPKLLDVAIPTDDYIKRNAKMNHSDEHWGSGGIKAADTWKKYPKLSANELQKKIIKDYEEAPMGGDPIRTLEFDFKEEAASPAGGN